MSSVQQKFDLEGVQVFDIKKNPDERGFFAEVARKDWLDVFGQQWVSQANLSASYPGMIRAWHRHDRGQIDYFMVLKGAMKIVAYDGDQKSPTFGKMAEVVGSDERLQIIRIPGKYWHGTKTVSNKPSLTMYFVNNMYDVKSPDEERKPWNDASIIDPRTKQAYDWNKPPHK